MDDKEKHESEGKGNPDDYEVGRFSKNAMIVLTGERERYSNHKDNLAAMTATFGKLRFEIESHSDITRKEFREILEQLSKRDFSDYGCIGLVILAHDSSFYWPHLYRYLDTKRNPSLGGKPIVIIIQQCGRYDTEMDFHLDLDYHRYHRHGYFGVQNQPDMLVIHHATHGRHSMRAKESSLIRILCEQIDKNSSKDDLETIFNRTSKLVVRDKHPYRSYKYFWGAVPSVTSTLLKKLYLVNQNQNQKNPSGVDPAETDVLSGAATVGVGASGQANLISQIIHGSTAELKLSEKIKSDQTKKSESASDETSESASDETSESASDEASESASDEEISLDARLYHPPTNLMETEDSKSSPSSKGPPSDTNGQAPSNENQSNTENTNTYSSILPNIGQNNSNHPKHLLKKYAPTYELEEYSRNVMLIFNHEKFLCDDPRPGTVKDKEALEETFTKFGFVIQPYMDLKRKALLEIVKTFAEQTDFTAYGCICIAILTHGGSTPGFLQAFDTSYSEHEILERFNAQKNPTLAAKPIIFLIQACRGRDPAPPVTAGNAPPGDHEFDHGRDSDHYTIPTESDMLIFHSSYIGRASVRSRTYGTWFIQTLCSMIKKHAATCDLETIFRKVKMAVALDAAEWVEDSHKAPKQMPVVTSTVIREIYLRPYDPRTVPDLLSVQAQSKDEVDHEVVDFKLDSMQISNETSETEDSPSTDETILSVQFMPCSCFLDYFTYLKKCLGLFISVNSDDLIAKMLMDMVEKEGDGVEHIFVKFRLMETIWEHLKKNPEKFPYDYVYRSYY